RELVVVVRLVAVRAPVPLVSARRRVEHDDAMVEVAVSDEQLVRLAVYEQARGPAEILAIAAARILAGVPDLQDEPARARELQNLVVFLRAAGEPYVVVGVDEDAVLGPEPLVSRARTAPGLQEFAIRRELEHRRRRKAALRLRWRERRGPLGFRDAPRALEHPDVVVGVDGDTANGAGDPVVRQQLRPERIGLELRPGRAPALRMTRARRDADQNAQRPRPGLSDPLVSPCPLPRT